MDPITQRLVTAVENSSAVHAVDAAATEATRDLVPRQGSWWHGAWLGHALHPILTDFPLGAFASATVLDLLGGHRSRPAAALLVGAGLVSSAPVVASGFADWSKMDGPDRQVATAHGAANSVALVLFAGSLVARGAQLHRTGTKLALLGNLVAGVSGYLGGHLTMNRAAAQRMDPTPPEAVRDLGAGAVT
ncbi:MAG: DUF2231 domain-containing protein [Nocardioidaceae bacterium]